MYKALHLLWGYLNLFVSLSSFLCSSISFHFLYLEAQLLEASWTLVNSPPCYEMTYALYPWYILCYEIFFDINIVPFDLVIWCIFSSLFSFSIFVFLYLKFIPCRQHIVGYCFFFFSIFFGGGTGV